MTSWRAQVSSSRTAASTSSRASRAGVVSSRAVRTRERARVLRLRARVRAVVHAAQPPGIDVAVDLRRRERAVPEQLLDRAQVGTSLEQVGRVRVTQPVRVPEEPAERRSCRAASHARRGRARRRRPAPAPAARRAGRRPRRDAARSPSGTTRSFPPLPRTCTARCSKSTSARSRPTASAERSPHE